ncbi:MAG: insulinase family protein [Hyphomicrobiales bacterium]|nr:insulinase family protein [Hyphomicrobiales bacterium]MCP5371140.1 insulinase family protein [Hyphomicrobiales bacterium]
MATTLARRLAAAIVLCVLVLAAVPAGAVSIQRVVSPGGVVAWLVEDHTNPIIALDLAFRGGATLDPEGREGLARMVSATLDEGAGGLDSQAFQGRLDDLSISLSFSAGRESFSGSLTTLTGNRDTAFDMLRLALTEPRFDPAPVARIRSQTLAGLRREAEDPDSIADKALMATLFPGHPYGRPAKGTPESVAAITADDLRGFVKRRLARQNLLVGVVGDITAAELAPLLDRTFGALPPRAAPWDLPEVAPARADTTVIRKPVPQSAISFAQPGLKRDDPDFYAAYVMNHILGGGGFTSRLFNEVREKRGLAYSVGTSLYPLDHAGLIVGDAGTANARVKDTLGQIRAEWRRIVKDGVTGDELKDAKTYLTGSFPLRFSSSGRIASMLVAIQMDKLGIDYLDRRNGLIEAVTMADIDRVIHRLLDPDKLVIVVVGEPEGLALAK